MKLNSLRQLIKEELKRALTELDEKGIVGLDILNYEPFKSLPETRNDMGNATTRMQPTLPSLEYGDARTTMFSKQDFVDHEVQGPKMVHEFDGYITLFKKKFGEEPIFVNLKDGRSGSADIANEKFLQWKNENLKSKEAWLDRERSAGKTSGLDELKKELNEIIDDILEETQLNELTAGSISVDDTFTLNGDLGPFKSGDKVRVTDKRMFGSQIHIYLSDDQGNTDDFIIDAEDEL